MIKSNSIRIMAICGLAITYYSYTRPHAKLYTTTINNTNNTSNNNDLPLLPSISRQNTNSIKPIKSIFSYYWNKASLLLSSLNHNNNTKNDFNEDICYSIDKKLIKEITEATYELHNLSLEVVDDVVGSNELMDLFEIPLSLREQIRISWFNREPDFLGQMKFIYDGLNPPKMIGYYYDYPQFLNEMSIEQESWAKGDNTNSIEEKEMPLDQFNFLTKAIKFSWQEILNHYKANNVFISYSKNIKNGLYQANTLRNTINYQDNPITLVNIENLQLDQDSLMLIDKTLSKDSNSHDKKSDLVYKLYPWHWMAYEQIGDYYGTIGNKEKKKGINEDMIKTKILEPAWKLILTNKALLPYLWKLYPDHPNLLPAYFIEDQYNNFPIQNETNESKSTNKWLARIKYPNSYIKPLISKDFESINNFLEKANNIHEKELIDESTNCIIKARFGKCIVHKYYDPLIFQSRRFNIHSWLVTGVPVGIGIEEYKDNISEEKKKKKKWIRPHYIRPTRKMDNIQEEEKAEGKIEDKTKWNVEDKAKWKAWEKAEWKVEENANLKAEEKAKWKIDEKVEEKDKLKDKEANNTIEFEFWPITQKHRNLYWSLYSSMSDKLIEHLYVKDKNIRGIGIIEDKEPKQRYEFIYRKKTNDISKKWFDNPYHLKILQVIGYAKQDILRNLRQNSIKESQNKENESINHVNNEFIASKMMP